MGILKKCNKIYCFKIWKSSKSTSKTYAHLLSWNINHLKNHPLAHSKHLDSSSFNPFQDPILNHMWKSAYGRYGHYVDYGLMGPLGCYIKQNVQEVGRFTQWRLTCQNQP
jgi:hypothetical protein